jgi:hypothetical protein
MPTRITRFFELRLTEIENASFDATIELGVEAIQTEDVTQTLSLTQERVDKAFKRITQGLAPDFALSPNTVVAFKKFGQSFQGSEGLEVHDGDNRRVYGKTQHDLLRELLVETTVEVDGTLIGKVFALDTNNKTFKLELPNGSDVPGSFENQSRWEQIRDVLDLPDSNTLIRLVARYVARQSGEPVRVEDVEAVEVFSRDDDQWTEPLTALAALNPGWLEGEGSRIEIPPIEMARDILRELSGDWMPLPALFPMPDGGVQLEWLTQSRHIELAISPDVEIHAHDYDAATRVSRDETAVGVAAAISFLRGAFDAS